jgi:DNA topoisomerase-1
LPDVGDIINMVNIDAKQEYLRPPGRYTDASLVKKMETLGIGRPSTYVSSVNHIVEKEYVKKGDVAGVTKNIINYSIKSNNDSFKHIMKIFEESATVSIGKDVGKIIPTQLGIQITEFMTKYFEELMDYKFTAKMEKDLDLIASGELDWVKFMKGFYKNFHPLVESLISKIPDIKTSKDRVLGEDENNVEIIASVAKYGPVVKKKVGSKYIYAPIKEPLTVQNITLKDALKLFEFPKMLGKYNNNSVFLQKGQYGFYIEYKDKKITVGDKLNVTLDEAIKIISDKMSNILKEGTIKDGKINIKYNILNGPHGFYVQAIRGDKKKNHPIKKDITAEQIKNLSDDEILAFIKAKRVFGSKSSGSKTATKTAYKGKTKK